MSAIPHTTGDDTRLILGIESSCDETAAAVVEDGRTVRSNIIASQHDLHAKFGGVVPEIASRAHMQRIGPVVQMAMAQADVKLHQLDAIAVGHRPGLIGSLLVAVAAAKTLAWSQHKPLIGIDHVHAHLWAAALDDEPIAYPALGLVVSGGHTNLYAVAGALDIRLLGRTIDDAVGEAGDKVAAILGLGFPGGPIIDRLAQRGSSASIHFPRTLLDADSLDFSFSGLKTAVLYHVRGKPIGRGRAATFERDADALSEQDKADVCAAFGAAAADVLIAKLDRAVQALTSRHDAPQSLIIGGGVSANSLLRQRAIEFGREHDLTVSLPKMDYCLDNAAMIAGLADARLQAGQCDDLTLPAVATTDLC